MVNLIMKNKKFLLLFIVFLSACSIEQASIPVASTLSPIKTPTQITPTMTSTQISTIEPVITSTSTVIVPTSTPTPTQETVWDFEYSSPTEQGFNVEKLEDLETIIMSNYPAVDSLLIARNGKTVFEMYQNGFDKNTRHRIYSGTKSILSLLVGIAIDQGYIESVDVPLIEFFPNEQIDNLGSMKESITLKHLLTMTSGIRCLEADTYGLDWWESALNKAGWINTFLDQPMISETGIEFYYCDGSANIVSAILEKSIGTSVYSFAREYLFEPLGIEDIYWHQLGGGYLNGSTGVHILPEDFAKIGSLVLSGGVWNGEQIVSEEWIKASTSKYIEGTFSDWFGYYWWIDDQGYISAFGLGNQLMYIIPEENLIVIIFCDPEKGSYYNIFAENILENLILPTVIN